ncbi:MAG TPA: hypothetical protein VFA60_00135 [Terriglobales bacterium]|nr:hypothetical protein [Terriglobales bacterium]
MGTEQPNSPSSVPPEDVRTPHVGYERRQLNARMIVFAVALLAVFALIVHLAVLGLATYMEGNARRADGRPGPMSEINSGRVPPEPRLQSNPVADLERLRAAEDQVLNGYAWIDKNAGVVRIPVAEAMKIVAQRGLPKAGPQPSKTQGKQQQGQ